MSLETTVLLSSESSEIRLNWLMSVLSWMYSPHLAQVCRSALCECVLAPCYSTVYN